jgi:hypothetical protein
MVKGRFGASAANWPCFGPEAAAIGAAKQEIPELLRPYRPVLLTMIKIVLNAAISFAARTQ